MKEAQYFSSSTVKHWVTEGSGGWMMRVMERGEKKAPTSTDWTSPAIIANETNEMPGVNSYTHLLPSLFSSQYSRRAVEQMTLLISLLLWCLWEYTPLCPFIAPPTHHSRMESVASQPAPPPPPSHTHIQDYHQACHSKLCVLMSPGWQWEAVGATDRYCTLHINADVHSSHHYFRLFQWQSHYTRWWCM